MMIFHDFAVVCLDFMFSCVKECLRFVFSISVVRFISDAYIGVSVVGTL